MNFPLPEVLTQPPEFLAGGLIALLGALVGSILSRANQERKDRRRRKALLRAIEKDLSQICDDVSSEQKGAQPEFRFRPYFPTFPWRELVSSGLIGGVEPTKQNLLEEVYARIEASNFYFEMLPHWLLLSVIVKDPALADRFRTWARDASDYPEDILKPQIENCLTIILRDS